MIRRVAREMVLQSLFQMDFTQAEPAEALAIALEVQQDEEKSEEAAKAVIYAEKVLKAIQDDTTPRKLKLNPYVEGVGAVQDFMPAAAQ